MIFLDKYSKLAAYQWLTAGAMNSRGRNAPLSKTPGQKTPVQSSNGWNIVKKGKRPSLYSLSPSFGKALR